MNVHVSIHVVFGHVIDGFSVVQLIEKQKTNETGRPLTDVRIAGCGELVLQGSRRRRGRIFAFVLSLLVILFILVPYKQIFNSKENGLSTQVHQSSLIFT